MRILAINFLAALLFGACSPPPRDVDAIDLPLSAVDGFSMGEEPPPIESAYKQYDDTMIAVEGIRLGPGLPAGLGSHQFVGLHEPPQFGREFRVLISGNVPTQQGKRYRVVGRIVPSGRIYEIAVEDWEELPLE